MDEAEIRSVALGLGVGQSAAVGPVVIVRQDQGTWLAVGGGTGVPFTMLRNLTSYVRAMIDARAAGG